MEIRATLRLRNNKLIEARKDRGLSQIELADLIAAPIRHIAALEGLQFQDFLEATAHKICAELELPIDDVFPHELKGTSISSTSHRVANIEDNRLLLSARYKERMQLPSPDEAILATDDAEQLRQAMKRLDGRHEYILRMRYGLDDDDPMTLIDISKRLSITIERARQIIVRAHHELRELLTTTDNP